MKNKYTDEEILEQLRKYYKKFPNMNSKTFNVDKSVCSSHTVILRFGSWENALRKAGVPIKKLTKEEISRQVKEFYEENKKISMASFNKDKKYCCSETVAKVFGSWENALIELGLRKPKDHIEYDKEKLLEVLKERVKQGKLKYRTDIGKLEGVPSWTYVKKLWSWDELVKILKLKKKSICLYR